MDGSYYCGGFGGAWYAMGGAFAEVTILPAQNANAKYPATIEEWKYGEVIEKLHKFIKDKGYKITGPHEEEYIRGPELIFRSPKNYMTIIRYEVRKK